MIEKNYQLQMWEIVKEKVKFYQSDVLYNVQVIARKGEDKQYLWVVRDRGTFIFAMPLNNVDAGSVHYVLKAYTGEMSWYIIHPAKNIISPIEEGKIKELLDNRVVTAREKVEKLLNNPEQLRIATEGIKQWLDSGKYGQCPFNQVD